MSGYAWIIWPADPQEAIKHGQLLCRQHLNRRDGVVILRETPDALKLPAPYTAERWNFIVRDNEAFYDPMHVAFFMKELTPRTSPPKLLFLVVTQ